MVGKMTRGPQQQHTKRFSAEEEALRVQKIVERKAELMASKGRCAACWHSKDNGHCICERLGSVSFDLDVRFALYTHWKEYYCAGDDAKLLAATAPDVAKVYVHGRRGDDDELAAVLRDPCAERRCLLLFPDDGAATVDEFFAVEHTPRIPRRERATG